MIKPPSTNGTSTIFASVRFAQPVPKSESFSAMVASDISQTAVSLPVSPEIAPLLDELFDAFFHSRSGRRGVKGFAPRSVLDADDESDETGLGDEARRRTAFGAMFNAMSDQNQSSEEHRQGRGKGYVLARMPDGEPEILNSMVSSKTLAYSFAHTDELSSLLPLRCAKYYARRGRASMKRFLLVVLISLLPALMRDLVVKLQAFKEMQLKLDHQNIWRPTVDVCEKLHAVMRPLFEMYVTGPIGVLEARAVLCATQVAMEKTFGAVAQIEIDVIRVVNSTLNPLLAVLIMGCITRPKPAQALGGCVPVAGIAS